MTHERLYARYVGLARTICTAFQLGHQPVSLPCLTARPARAMAKKIRLAPKIASTTKISILHLLCIFYIVCPR